MADRPAAATVAARRLPDREPRLLLVLSRARTTSRDVGLRFVNGCVVQRQTLVFAGGPYWTSTSWMTITTPRPAPCRTYRNPQGIALPTDSRTPARCPPDRDGHAGVRIAATAFIGDHRPPEMEARFFFSARAAVVRSHDVEESRWNSKKIPRPNGTLVRGLEGFVPSPAGPFRTPPRGFFGMC